MHFTHIELGQMQCKQEIQYFVRGNICINTILNVVLQYFRDVFAKSHHVHIKIFLTENENNAKRINQH